MFCFCWVLRYLQENLNVSKHCGENKSPFNLMGQKGWWVWGTRRALKGGNHGTGTSPAWPGGGVGAAHVTKDRGTRTRHSKVPAGAQSTSAVTMMAGVDHIWGEFGGKPLYHELSMGSLWNCHFWMGLCLLGTDRFQFTQEDKSARISLLSAFSSYLGVPGGHGSRTGALFIMTQQTLPKRYVWTPWSLSEPQATQVDLLLSPALPHFGGGCMQIFGEEWPLPHSQSFFLVSWHWPSTDPKGEHPSHQHHPNTLIHSVWGRDRCRTQAGARRILLEAFAKFLQGAASFPSLGTGVATLTGGTLLEATRGTSLRMKPTRQKDELRGRANQTNSITWVPGSGRPGLFCSGSQPSFVFHMSSLNWLSDSCREWLLWPF